jgi:flagellar motility protein MotE (MotC chaperone)
MKLSGTAIDSTDFDRWFEKQFGKRPEGSLYTLQLELEQAQRKAANLQERIATIDQWEARRYAALLALQNSMNIGRNS